MIDIENYIRPYILHALAHCHIDRRKKDYKIEKLFDQHSKFSQSAGISNSQPDWHTVTVTGEGRIRSRNYLINIANYMLQYMPWHSGTVSVTGERTIIK